MKRIWLHWLAACVLAGPNLARATDLPGLLNWSQPVTLSTPVTGVVETVSARPGHVVKAGELLLSLNAQRFKALLAEARAEVDRLGEEQADAKRELDRVQELYARTVSSTTELDVAKLRHARAMAALAGAQARLELARRQLAESEIRAPFAAIVLERQAEPGMAVAGQCQPSPLLRVARADELVAQARLKPGQLAQAAVGSNVEVVVGGNRYRSRIRAITYDGQGDAPYVLEAAIPRAETLGAGQPATLRLP